MSPALEIADLHAWHGESHVLRGVNLQVAPGEIVVLLGREGSGRTATLHATLGLMHTRTGSVRIGGTESITLSSHKIARLGVGYCAGEHEVFAGLSCEENLLLPMSADDGTLGGGMPLAEIYDLFPSLLAQRHAPGAGLPRGDRRMLAVARLLRTGANLLLLDDILEGLTPTATEAFMRISPALKTKGYTMLMVERGLRHATPLGDRYYVMTDGRISDQFNASDLRNKHAALETLLDTRVLPPHNDRRGRADSCHGGTLTDRGDTSTYHQPLQQ